VYTIPLPKDTEQHSGSLPKTAHHTETESGLQKESQFKNGIGIETSPKFSVPHENDLATPIVDLLTDTKVRRILNADRNFERIRYLAALAASSEPLFQTGGTMVDGRITFNLRQLWRVATRLGLDFERFRGAERVFGLLESSGYVKTIRNQQTGFHTQYYPTDLGIAQVIVTLDRLKKMQGIEARAKAMQAVEVKRPSAAPTVYEVLLNQRHFAIGSGAGNDLCVDDRDMSPKHARVTYESGRWVFEDLKSAYGSWKMEPNNMTRLERAELADNDLYQLGSTIIRFRIPSVFPTR